MDQQKLLAGLLDDKAPKVATAFYSRLEGFQDPFGEGRRLILKRVLDDCAVRLLTRQPEASIDNVIRQTIDSCPMLPPPINVDYRQFRTVGPFPPHVVCYALAYIKEYPKHEYVQPFTLLVVRTGWWAGDENCVDDILGALAYEDEVCQTAADSLATPLSPQSVFSAGQLLYHLRYGVDCGMYEYVKDRYQQALRSLTDAENRADVERRLDSGLKPWIRHP
jgi:hypothetical protein